MDLLPLELIHHIGSYLSLWDRCRLRRVCWDYYQLFKPPVFFKLPPVQRDHAGRLLRILQKSPGVVDGSALTQSREKLAVLMMLCRDLNLSLTVVGRSAMFIQEYRRLAQQYGITDVMSGELDDAAWEERIISGTMVLYETMGAIKIPEKYVLRFAQIAESKSPSRIVYHTPILVLDQQLIYTILTVLGIITQPVRLIEGNAFYANYNELLILFLAWCCQKDPDLGLLQLDLTRVEAAPLINFLFMHYIEPYYCRCLPVDYQLGRDYIGSRLIVNQSEESQN